MSRHELLSTIVSNKQALANTDYKTLKFSEGVLTENDYAPVRELRERLRAEIRQCEAELERLGNAGPDEF